MAVAFDVQCLIASKLKCATLTLGVIALHINRFGGQPQSAIG